MIQLLLVTNPETINVDFKSTYESLFPPDERREWGQLLGLVGHPPFKLFEISAHGKFIGFISVWNLSDFSFIEHFGIRTSEQGKGYGAQALRQVLSISPKPVVLEVEEPLTETAQRRIAFYKRLNFSVNSGSYFQPPYSIEKSSIKMLIMSYPNKIETFGFEKIKAHIHDRVYGYGNEVRDFE